MKTTSNKISRVQHDRMEKELFALLTKYNVSKEDKMALLHHAFVLVGIQIEQQGTIKRVAESLLGPRSAEPASHPERKKATIGF